MKNFVFVILATFITVNLTAQCENWNNMANKDELIGWHSIYQSNLKNGNTAISFENWEKVYAVAPAADGKRASHYLDGIELYKKKLETETEESKIKEYHDAIIRLYDEAITCYENKSITLKGCNNDKCLEERIGFLHGRKAYDLYYLVNADRGKSFDAFKKSMELSGNKTEYFVVGPLGDLLAGMVKNEKIGIPEARKIHAKLIEISDYNIANNKQYKQYFIDGKQAMESYIAQVEGTMYDCEYFKAKLLPEYESNPNDGKIIEKVFVKLKAQGCDESEPIMMELRGKYDVYLEAEKQKELERLAKTNPDIAAQLFYNNDEFDKAAEKYQEAIDNESDPEKLADYYFRLASIQGRKLSQYSSARANARKAASLKSGWGRPYMLIGDLYAKTSRSCGDSWNQRLAVLAAIDKYAYAKSIDSSVASEANKRIGSYASSKPTTGEAHQRGLKEGQSVEVGCWIDETVQLRF